jgi:hypothetical protein
MAKSNAFVKEYVTGRKDQFDLDYSIFRETVKSTKDREALITQMEKKFNFVIAHIAEDRANTLKQDMGLL